MDSFEPGKTDSLVVLQIRIWRDEQRARPKLKKEYSLFVYIIKEARYVSFSQNLSRVSSLVTTCHS